MADLVVAIDARKAKRGADEFDRSVDKIDRGARRVDRGVGRADRQMESAGRSAGALGLMLRRVVGPLAAMATIGRSLGLAAEAEKTSIAFTTMLGSQEKAMAMIRDIEQFAASTPFQFQGLASTVRLTLALGTSADKALPRVKTVADAVSALGGNDEMMRRIVLALGQMEAKGKVSAEEMRQLAEAGIPAWEMLAKAIGVGIPEAMKLSERGAIQSAGAVEAILDGMNQRFAGATAALAQTTSGLWSTFKDNVSFALRDVGKVLIETFDIPTVLRAATTFVKGFAADFRQVIDIMRGVEGAYDNASDSAQTMSDVLNGLIIATKAWIGLKIAGAVIGASNAFLKLATSIKLTGKALGKSIVGLAAVAALQFVDLDKLLGKILGKFRKLTDLGDVPIPGASDPNSSEFNSTGTTFVTASSLAPDRLRIARRQLDELKAERQALGLTNRERDRKIALLRFEQIASRGSAEESAKLVKQYEQEFAALQRGQDFRDAGEIVGRGFGNGFQTAFDTILENGRLAARELRDIFQGIARDIASALFNRFVVQRLVDGIASAAGGFAGASAGGGGPRATPGNSGDFIRRGGGGGGLGFSRFDPPPQDRGRTGNVVLNIQTPDSRSFRRSQAQIAEDMRRAQSR